MWQQTWDCFNFSSFSTRWRSRARSRSGYHWCELYNVPYESFLLFQRGRVQVKNSCGENNSFTASISWLFEIVKNVKSLDSLPCNRYFNVFSLEVKCEVLTETVNLLLYVCSWLLKLSTTWRVLARFLVIGILMRFPWRSSARFVLRELIFYCFYFVTF